MLIDAYHPDSDSAFGDFLGRGILAETNPDGAHTSLVCFVLHFGYVSASAMYFSGLYLSVFLHRMRAMGCMPKLAMTSSVDTAQLIEQQENYEALWRHPPLVNAMDQALAQPLASLNDHGFVRYGGVE